MSCEDIRTLVEGEPEELYDLKHCRFYWNHGGYWDLPIQINCLQLRMHFVKIPDFDVLVEGDRHLRLIGAEHKPLEGLSLRVVGQCKTVGKAIRFEDSGGEAVVGDG